MAVLLIAASFAATFAFLFVAPALADRPRLLIAWLLLALLVWLAGLARLVSGSAVSRPPLDSRAASLTVGVGFACVFAAFVSAPVFLSDDSIRHIHDGYYLLQGVDVYTTPPERLPRLLDRLPNHPDVGTIYLPFTQLQALIGAAIHPHRGFLSVYYAVAWLAMLLAWRWARPGWERVLLLAFWTSPIFLITSAARHADVQGTLLVIVALLALRRVRVLAAVRSTGFKGRGCGTGAGPALVGGAALALAAGLKPEGGLYAGTFGLAVLVWLNSRWRGGDRGLALSCGVAFAGGAGLVGGGLLAFAVLVLFAGDQAWPSFLFTVRLFTDWFAAYNPLLELLEWWHSQSERPQLMAVYRRGVGLIALGLFGLFALRSWRRPRRGHRAAAHLRKFWRSLWLSGLLILVAASVTSKGVWHPWYFLWLLPALWLTG